MSDEKDYFDSSNLLVFFYKYKKAFMAIGAIALISSTVISYILPEKYLSTVVVYPPNTSSIAKALINTNDGNKDNIMEFGEEEKTEQMLEVINSELVKQRIIAEFDLMKHYGIDSNSTNTPFTDLQKRFKKNISFKRNVNMAIEIEVLDENPLVASEIANRIVTVADDVMNEIQKKRAVKGFDIVDKAYKEKLKEITQMEQELAAIMKDGVLDIESQAEVYSDAYAQAVAKGNKQAVKDLDEKMKVLSKHGARFLSLKEQLENERLKVSDLKAKYDEAKLDAEERIPNFFVLTKAFPAEKKAYPIRSLIVALSTIGSLLIGFLALLFFEQIQKVKSNIALNE